MKTLPLASAIALVVVFGSAQSLRAQPSDHGAANQSQMNAPDHPGQSQWDRDRDGQPRPPWQGPSYGWMGPWMMGRGPGWMMGPRAGWIMRGHPGWMMGPRAGWRRWHHNRGGAHFRFARGNARIDIQCPADQSLKDCVDAASTLIDKVAHMGPSEPPPTPPGTNNGRGGGPLMQPGEANRPGNRP
jgi:hypothetical protein